MTCLYLSPLEKKIYNIQIFFFWSICFIVQYIIFINTLYADVLQQ